MLLQLKLFPEFLPSPHRETSLILTVFFENLLPPIQGGRKLWKCGGIILINTTIS